MENKCGKYEGLFLFSDEKTLEEHIKNCPDCRREREKEEKLSLLLKDSKDEYQKLVKKNFKKFCTQIACMLLFFVGIGAATSYGIYSSYSFIKKTAYNSVIESSGLPTDEFGFFDYDYN